MLLVDTSNGSLSVLASGGWAMIHVYVLQIPLNMLHHRIHQIQKLKFLGTNSNETKISI